MIDSEFWESVVVVDEASVPVADELVVAGVAGPGGEGPREWGPLGRGCVRAVAFEGELALEAVDDRFDPLAHGAEFAEAAWLVLAIGPQQPAAHLLDHGLELAAGKALISEDRAPRDGEAFKDFRGDLAFADVGGGQLKADRHAVRCANEHEPEAPVVAGMRAAPAVGGITGQLGPGGAPARGAPTGAG